MGTDSESDLRIIRPESRESFRQALWRKLVIRPVLAWQEMRCMRARAYLLTHDYDFRSSEVGMEIVNRRNKLYRQGMSPADPKLPNRWSIEKELPPMSWPRNPRRFGPFVD